ncbi:GAF and ANTAR domain-containing protein [soil metagenome]
MTDTPPDRQLLHVLVEFITTMVSDFTAEQALDGLMEQVPAILGVDGAGIMLEDDTGELRFVAASDDTVRLIEQFQVETGEGPCVMAYETGRPVQTDDLSGETPFPAFAQAAMAAGLNAVHSFPMMLETARVGALNLYRETTGPLPPDGVEHGQLFADIATSYLFTARRHDRLTRQIEGLRNAISENGAVDQAKGVLMHTYGLEDREAFALLRRYARTTRSRVLDVSRGLMDGQLDPKELLIRD